MLGLSVVLAWAAAGEMIGLFRQGGWLTDSAVITGGAVIVTAANAMGRVYVWRGTPDPLAGWGWPLAAFALVLVAALINKVIRYRQPGHSIQPLALEMLAVAYVGILFSFTAQLRWTGVDGDTRGSWGLVALVSLLAVVKLGDIGAYTLGRLFGGKIFQRKMAPYLSPGKTLEGACGAVLFAVLAAWVALEQVAPVWTGSPGGRGGGWLAYGVIVGLAGLFGDLAESLLKREVAAKDSSTWMPGFGGVLDMLDSILLAAPVAWLCWTLGLVGP